MAKTKTSPAGPSRALTRTREERDSLKVKNKDLRADVRLLEDTLEAYPLTASLTNLVGQATGAVEVGFTRGLTGKKKLGPVRYELLFGGTNLLLSGGAYLAGWNGVSGFFMSRAGGDLSPLVTDLSADLAQMVAIKAGLRESNVVDIGDKKTAEGGK